MKKILFILLISIPRLLLSQVSIDMGASARGSDVVILTDTTSASSKYGKLYYYSGNYYAGNSDGYYDIIPNPPTGSLSDGDVITWDNTSKAWVPASQGSSAYLQADWISNYTSTKDTIGIRSRPKFRPLGNALSLDGTDDYAYHTDDADLEFGGVDGGLAVMIKTSAASDTFLAKRSTGAGWLLATDSNGKAYFFMSDGTTTASITSANAINDGVWHYIAIALDVSGSGYLFVDGVWSATATISTVGSMDNAVELDVGKFSGAGTYSNGDVDEVRYPFNFGSGGLYTAGTGGTDLEIRVGSSSGDIIYSEVSPYSPSNPGGMIPLMYKSPSTSLSDIGFSPLEDADRTNKLTGDDTDFESSIGSWVAELTEVLAHETTITHDGSSGSMSVTFDGSTKWGGRSKDITLAPDVWYEMSGWVYLSAGFTNGLNFKIIDGSSFTGRTLIEVVKHSGTPEVWERISSFIKVVSSHKVGKIYFIAGSAPANGDIAYIDDVQVTRVGEVAHWKMNETGTPATLTDETSNSLDLTLSGSPSMAANDYETLSLVRASIDTVYADTLNSRIGEFAGVYLGDNSTAPGAGTAKAKLYAASGEIYAHDASGNNTLISPHFGNDWVYNSWNSNTGQRTFINLFSLAKAIEGLTGKKFIYKDTVAVQIPDSIAADTSYVTVYDSLMDKNVTIRIIKAKRGYLKRDGKYYKVRKEYIEEPPTEYKKDHKTVFRAMQ